MILVQLNFPFNRELNRELLMPALPRARDNFYLGDTAFIVVSVVWFLQEKDVLLVRINLWDAEYFHKHDRKS